MQKRLFFGAEVHAPWPERYPNGRLLNETHRHMTLAFLGNVDDERLQHELSSFPTPPFKVGFAGYFDDCLLLPPRFPRVVAWHIQWTEESTPLLNFQKALVDWLNGCGYEIREKREFLPHVTVCRSPFNHKEWKRHFSPIPCMTGTLNLYESKGNLQYESIWSHEILPPFEEIEHTADIAFSIHGESLQQLHKHAQTALAFHYPKLLPYLSENKEVDSLERIVTELNRVICKADAEIGCPFKAVSFHGSVNEENGLLKWEMIVDV